MPRRREVPKREVLPDPKFGNVEVAKFMIVLMLAGKKSVAERIVYGAFEQIQTKAGKDPLADCAKVKSLHSAVGVSHRNVAFSVAGPAAEACLNAGCPQDLSPAAFPVGACSRTVLGKVEIVLHRTADDAFRVECWRSFSDYVFTFLSEAARDAAA